MCSTTWYCRHVDLPIPCLNENSRRTDEVAEELRIEPEAIIRRVLYAFVRPVLTWCIGDGIPVQGRYGDIVNLCIIEPHTLQFTSTCEAAWTVEEKGALEQLTL